MPTFYTTIEHILYDLDNLLANQTNGSQTITIVAGPVATNSSTFTAAGSGVTLDVHSTPTKKFAIQVKATGSVTSWIVVLEGSLDNTNFATILTHNNTSPGDGKIMWSGTLDSPVLYFRARCTAISLGAGTNVVATILGV